MKKRVILFGLIFAFAFLVITFTSAQETGYCCERLDNDGNWCQTVTDQAECDPNYQSLATSCDQTSFCSLGTCVNQREGTCTEGVPKTVCEPEELNFTSRGYWVNAPKSEVTQCQLGCCIYGGNAFLGTSTQCSHQGSLSGIEPDFDPTIQDEITCIANVLDEVEGACVYQESVGTISCRRLTKAECDQLSTSGIIADSIKFESGMLCSAPQLETICGPTKNTICDEYNVYYTDSCGNTANIYDVNRYENDVYWSFIDDEVECDDGKGNKNSGTCGQCSYFDGSLCKNYRDAGTSKPADGDYICASLDCDLNGNGEIEKNKGEAKHGESWCGISFGTTDLSINEDSTGFEYRGDLAEQNLPGSRYVSYECRNGEVIETACDPYRNTVCAENYYDINQNGNLDNADFTVASCVENRWQDCIIQDDKDECEDETFRDCQWVVGASYYTEDGEPYAFEDLNDNDERDSGEKPASCVPKFAPGLDFWEAPQNDEGDTECSIASQECVAVYEASWLFSNNKKCIENCHCVPGNDGYDEWRASLNLMCLSLGDCGPKLNYVGELGEERDDILDVADFHKV